MSKLHYDHHFNKVLSASVVVFMVATLTFNLGIGTIIFTAYWAFYNFKKLNQTKTPNKTINMNGVDGDDKQNNGVRSV